MPARLRWWRWRLGAAPTTALVSTRMVEITPQPGPSSSSTATARAGARVLVHDVVLELPSTMTPADLGTLVGAIRASC